MALKREFNHKRNFYWKKVIDELIRSGVYEDGNKDDIYEEIKKSVEIEDKNPNENVLERNVSDYIKIEETIHLQHGP